jgi:manganese/iron transport system permease protein
VSPILCKVLLGAVLGGAGCALVGFLLVTLRVPFLAVCLSHAAMAGAVLGHLTGLPPLPLAFAGSLLAAAVLGPLSDSTRADPNTVMAILFTAFLGLTFLGIGLAHGPKSELLSLLWGSILLVRWSDLIGMGVATAVGAAAVLLFYKEFKAILFDRHLAALSGLRAHALFYLLLVIAGGVITVNLYAVGGLMLFSLLVNPAAAALQLGCRFSRALLLSVGIGIFSAAAGLAVSFFLGWPAGASIVIVSSLVFVAAAAFRIARGVEA